MHSEKHNSRRTPTRGPSHPVHTPHTRREQVWCGHAWLCSPRRKPTCGGCLRRPTGVSASASGPSWPCCVEPPRPSRRPLVAAPPRPGWGAQPPPLRGRAGEGPRAVLGVDAIVTVRRRGWMLRTDAIAIAAAIVAAIPGDRARLSTCSQADHGRPRPPSPRPAHRRRRGQARRRGLERVGVPTVLGEIVAGIVIGPSVLGLIELDGARGVSLGDPRRDRRAPAARAGGDGDGPRRARPGRPSVAARRRRGRRRAVRRRGASPVSGSGETPRPASSSVPP